MNRPTARIAGLTFAVLLAATAAQAVAAVDVPSTQQAADPVPHPVLPESSRWPVYAFRAIGAIFVLAAVIGPIVRKEFPQDLPPVTHAHDEPPGTSGHHGPAGTKDVTPPGHT